MLIRTESIAFPVLNRHIRTVTPKVVSNRVRVDDNLRRIKACSWSEVGAISGFELQWTQVLAAGSLSCRCLEALLNRSIVIVIFLHSLQVDIELVLSNNLCQLRLGHHSFNDWLLSFQVTHSHLS